MRKTLLTLALAATGVASAWAQDTQDSQDSQDTHSTLLTELKVGEDEIELKDGLYDYYYISDVAAATLETSITFVTKDADATVTPTLEGATFTLTVECSGDAGSDADAVEPSTYTLTVVKNAQVQSGYLNVEMGGEKIAENEKSQIFLLPNGDKTDLVLADLTLANLGLSLGNIVLPTEVTSNDETDRYSGSVENMKLAGGQLTANVSLSGGTITTSDKVVNFPIVVAWVQDPSSDPIPIEVSFTTGKKHSSLLTELKVGNDKIELKDGLYDYYYVSDGAAATVKDDVTYETKASAATVVPSVDESVITLTVTDGDDNGKSSDPDGKGTRTYTLTVVKNAQVQSGYLNVEMSGTKIAENQASRIFLLPNGEKTDLVLADLTLEIGGTPLPLGNIVLPTTKSTSDGIDTYTGSVDAMKLAGGALTANVSLTGTITGSDVDFPIVVAWVQDDPKAEPVPIEVSFTTKQKETALAPVRTVTAEGTATTYDLQGRQVPATHKGLVIVRQGGKAALRLNK